jgi:hypothetical protein
MKKLIILLFVFVFVTILVSSCAVALRPDNARGYYDNDRTSVTYRNYDDRGNYRRNGKMYRNRHQRINHSYLKVTDGENSLIIH